MFKRIDIDPKLDLILERTVDVPRELESYGDFRWVLVPQVGFL